MSTQVVTDCPKHRFKADELCPACTTEAPRLSAEEMQRRQIIWQRQREANKETFDRTPTLAQISSRLVWGEGPILRKKKR